MPQPLTDKNSIKKLNIWLLQLGEVLPITGDIPKKRTALLAEKLAENGHRCLWWASAFCHYKKSWVFNRDTEYELSPNITIKALKGCGYKKNFSFSRFLDHRIIARKFRKYAQKMPLPDIIVASVPPPDLACEAVLFAKKNKIPVLLDIRDQWPDVFFNYVPFWSRKFIRIIFFWDFFITKKAMEAADGLVAIMNTLLQWGLKYANRQISCKDRVFYLGYKKNTSPGPKSDKSIKLAEHIKNKFVVTFIGSFTVLCSPRILLTCAEELIGNQDICFVLAGEGQSFNQISEMSKKLPNVIITGWLNQDEIDTLLAHSHIGICPADVTIDAFTNKTFAYLAYGLPVISSYQGDLKEVIQKHQIGFYYQPNDREELKRCVLKLYGDPDLRSRMSLNAKRIFQEEFNSDRVYTRYAAHIENVFMDMKSRVKFNGGNYFLKRQFDFILALAGAFFFMPIYALISFLIYIDDGWPILFLQERVGKYGRMFKIIKFRTMKKTADPYRDVDLLGEDARLTKIGRLLRATAMDELPQLINILKGEMSFVGPKPLVYPIEDNECARYKYLDQVPGYAQRIKAVPGLTGIAQVYTPKNSSREEKFVYDNEYISKQSLLLDIKLILVSFYITIKGKWESVRKKI